MAYLDNAATTQVCDAAVERMVRCMTQVYGNPSSLHSMGIAAEEELEQARRFVAALIGAEAAQIVFTSGGTEANNLAILGGAAAKARRPHKAVTTAYEHSSVAAAFDELERQGWQVTRVAPDERGVITPQSVAAACDADTTLVSVMAVNNETGAVTDIAALTKLVRARAPEALIHTDCVQAAGKIPVKATRWGVDLLTVSSHKIHGPKGCGALYVRKGVRILPRQVGGEQERGLRAGTEGLPAIVGFGAAASQMPNIAEQTARYEALKAALIAGLSDLTEVRFHLPEGGVPYIVNLSLVGFRSETLLHFLAARDIYVSGGSACAKGKHSRVLTAMGLSEPEVDGALRISFCRHTTQTDVTDLCAALHEAVATLQRRKV